MYVRTVLDNNSTELHLDTGEDQKEALSRSGLAYCKLVGWRRQCSRGDKDEEKKNWRGRTFFRVIASAMQKLGYCGELGALSHLSVFSLFPFLVPKG